MKHLKDANEGYVCEHDGRIRPISTVDGEIIKEVLQILDLRGGNNDLLKILRKWKKDQDGHVLDELVQYSLTIDDETGEDASEGGGKSRKSVGFVVIKNQTFQISGLLYIKQVDRWKDREIYSIVINPDTFVSEKAMYKDVYIDFYNEEDRNKYFEKVQRKLEENEGIRFIKIE